MKIQIKFINSNRFLTDFIVSVNGMNCGMLCMKTNEAASFHQILAHGCSKDIDEFVSTGKIHNGEKDA